MDSRRNRCWCAAASPMLSRTAANHQCLPTGTLLSWTAGGRGRADLISYIDRASGRSLPLDVELVRKARERHNVVRDQHFDPRKRQGLFSGTYSWDTRGLANG